MQITDETIEYVGILAKLELSEEEKEQAKKDMTSMLDYVGKLNELDTEGVDLGGRRIIKKNVFREDVVTNGDDRDKELRTYHIHLRITVRDIHDSFVVEITVCFKHGYQYRIFTVLLVSVFIEFTEEVFVFVLGGSRFIFVLHLKHDGDDLGAVIVIITEDEVPF